MVTATARNPLHFQRGARRVYHLDKPGLITALIKLQLGTAPESHPGEHAIRTTDDATSDVDANSIVPDRMQEYKVF